MPEVLLSVKGLGCSFDGGSDALIFQTLDFEVCTGDLLVLRGKSGSGKTTLLKCLAHLTPYQGQIKYRDKTAKEHGVPNYRTKVLYVPQRPSLLPSTPRAFLQIVQSFASRTEKKRRGEHKTMDPVEVAGNWDVDEELWDRDWSNLSGGEAQRVALAIAVGLGTAEILLLDEPTSALDAATTSLVEGYIIQALKSTDNGLKAVICITHSKEQGSRLGTRFLDMEAIAHVDARRREENAVSPSA